MWVRKVVESLPEHQHGCKHNVCSLCFFQWKSSTTADVASFEKEHKGLLCISFIPEQLIAVN